MTLATIGLLLMLPLSSRAQDLQISFDPPFPTWRDAVTIIVSGPGPHCTPELSAPQVSFQNGWIVDLDLTDDCLLGPPSPDPFVVTTTLEPQPPRAMEVRVRDDEDGGAISTAALTIHPGADLELRFEEPARSDEPLRFHLGGVGACPEVGVASIGGGAVRVDYSGNCPILPPGEHVFELSLEAGPLPPGEHWIVVLDHTRGEEPPPIVTERVRVWDAGRCVPSETALCLQGGRFRVEARWTDFQDRSGPGRAHPASLDDTGLFWFFAPDNVELTVKVLAGCGVNGRFWVFLSAGSTVEFEVDVTDTANGQKRTYRNALGQIPELVPDTAAFATCQ